MAYEARYKERVLEYLSEGHINGNFISRLIPDIDLFERVVRGHWAIESMQLDVPFREDANITLDRQVAFSMNIMRKFCLSALKVLDIGMKASLKGKHCAVCCNPIKHIALAMRLYIAALYQKFRGSVRFS